MQEIIFYGLGIVLIGLAATVIGLLWVILISLLKDLKKKDD